MYFNLYPEINPTITYKDWRAKYNPWANNFFIGNLNPEDATEANIIDEIHSIIDGYFEPRYIGVQDKDRFKILFYARLRGIENKFFKAFSLDSYYPAIKDILSNIQLLNDKAETASENNTSTTTQNNNLKDDRTITYSPEKQASTQTNNLTDSTSTTQGEQTNTTDNSKTGTITKDNVYGAKASTNTRTDNLNEAVENIYGEQSSTSTNSQNTTSDTTNNLGERITTGQRTDDLTDSTNGTNTTTFGKIEKNDSSSSSNSTNRGLASDTPQSNVSDVTTGLDTDIKWTYATQLQDNLSKVNGSANNTLTNSGSDKLDTTNQTKHTGTQSTTNTENKVTDTSSTTNDLNSTLNNTLNTHTDNSTNTKTGTQTHKINDDSYTDKLTDTTNLSDDTTTTLGARTDTSTLTKTGTINNTLTIDTKNTKDILNKTGSVSTELTGNQTSDIKTDESLEGRNLKLSELINDFEDLCYKAISPYFYLFEHVEELFFSVWDTIY